MKKEFKKQQTTGVSSYKQFKKEWIAKKLRAEKEEVERLAQEDFKKKDMDVER